MPRDIAGLGYLRAAQEEIRRLLSDNPADMKLLRDFHDVTQLTGDEAVRVDALLDAGLACIAGKQAALGLEALGMGCMADIRDGIHRLSEYEYAQRVADAYVTAAAQTRPKDLREPTGRKSGRIRLAYVVPNLIDDVNSPSKRIQHLVRLHDKSLFDIRVYSSEVFCRRPASRFFLVQMYPSSLDRAPKMLSGFRKNNIPVYLAPTNGDLLDSATALHNRLVADGIDVAVYQSSPACPLDSVVAAWRAAPVQINLNIGVPMYVRHIDCTAHMTQPDYEADKKNRPDHRVERFHGAIDLDPERSETLTRKTLGIPDDAIVLVTSSNALPKRMTPEFVRMVGAVMKKHPKTHYLLIGPGDVSAQAQGFAAQGVLDRIRVVGIRTDTRSLLSAVADIYVNEFPIGGAQSVLEAMEAGLAVVAVKSSNKHQGCIGAEYAGPDGTTTLTDFETFLSGLIAVEPLRKSQGQAMRKRVEDEYSWEAVVKSLEGLYRSLLEGKR